jgi:fumarate reductase subunit D
MRQLDHGTRLPRPVKVRRAAAFLAILAGAGSVVSALLGAPLVSILLVGLLLIYPLLTWVPFRTRGKERHPDEPEAPR